MTIISNYNEISVHDLDKLSKFLRRVPNNDDLFMGVFEEKHLEAVELEEKNIKLHFQAQAFLTAS